MTNVIHFIDAPNGWKTDDNFVFVGQGSPWANPNLYPMMTWRLERGSSQFTRDERKQVEAWQRWFGWQSDLIKRLPELVGKTLVVDYFGDNTHAHILARRANQLEPVNKLTPGRLFACLSLFRPYCMTDGKQNRSKRLWVASRLLGRHITTFNDLTDEDWYNLRGWAYPNWQDDDWTVSKAFDESATHHSLTFEFEEVE